jgi:hypothetical protein
LFDLGGHGAGAGLMFGVSDSTGKCLPPFCHLVVHFAGRANFLQSRIDFRGKFWTAVLYIRQAEFSFV